VPSDADGLLRAILADPADDLPRLAYADWLEEQGESDRAEFVRVQYELTQLAFLDDDVCPRCGAGVGQYHENDCPATRLRRREKELLNWPAGEEGGYPCWRCAWHAPVPHGGWAWEYRRGFVARVECATADFLAHAAALFSSQPVEEVRLSDREPGAAGETTKDKDCNWSRAEEGEKLEYPWWLPPEIFAKLTPRHGTINAYYGHPELAVADLSRACVRYGREVAGLPPSPESCPSFPPNLD
jgi:uncharacterized protein (TIGR02996 family)